MAQAIDRVDHIISKEEVVFSFGPEIKPVLEVSLVHVYYDGASLMRQLGVFPPRPEVLGRILIYQAMKLRSWVRQRR